MIKKSIYPKVSGTSVGAVVGEDTKACIQLTLDGQSSAVSYTSLNGALQAICNNSEKVQLWTQDHILSDEKLQQFGIPALSNSNLKGLDALDLLKLLVNKTEN